MTMGECGKTSVGRVYDDDRCNVGLFLRRVRAECQASIYEAGHAPRLAGHGPR